MRWVRSDDWVGSQIEDSFVMLDIESGQYVAMNATAADVWHALDEPRSEQELVRLLSAKYVVMPETCLASVRVLLSGMAQKRLVRQMSGD